MSDVKMCERDGKFFIERAPMSIRVQQAVIYDENRKPQQFSGDFCPECGTEIIRQHSQLTMLAPVIDPQDREE